jgi:phage recombination protein Bet
MQNAREMSREEDGPEVVTRELVEKYLSVADGETPLIDAEKERFIITAVTYQLNPFKRELHAKISVEDGKRKMNLIVGYEVYIKKAERTGLLDGWKAWIEGAGDTLKAVVEIQRKDWKNPFVHEVYWAEAVQRRADGSVFDFWERMPKFQLKKVAISQGFRLCFSAEFGGIPYDGSELPIQETVIPANRGNPPPKPGSVPAAIVRPNDTGGQPTESLPESIHQLVMANHILFSAQHAEWIENQLRAEKTEAQLRGLLKHVQETISSGGDEAGGPNPHPQARRQSVPRRRIPTIRPAQPSKPEQVPIF